MGGLPGIRNSPVVGEDDRMIDRAEIEQSLQGSGADTVIDVWVVPGAGRTEVVGMHDGAVRVRIASPAEGGQANRALLQLIEGIIGAGSRLERGAKSRRKQVRVVGCGPATVADLLVQHLAQRL
ncbi:MAG: DUF167 domain-containing protein [Acidimicrobiia bacterium]|nr:DUF167 domain-containing protein [Acidimicrobiia bacterium]